MSSQFDGLEYVLSSLREARNRLGKMDSEEKYRDASEIWEALCDVEQAIEVSKFVFHLHDRLGKVRTLTVSSKNSPATLDLDELKSRYRFVESALVSADIAYREGKAEDAIEWARKARDQLKILLLGKYKSERLKLRKGRHQLVP